MWTSVSKALVCAALALPLASVAGTVVDRTKQPAVRDDKADKAQGGYVLRCWQDGRLILEEQHVSLPIAPDSAQTKLQLQDRNRQPLLVAETRNATCLVRAQAPARPRSSRP
jgi:hypothetical protein